MTGDYDLPFTKARAYHREHDLPTLLRQAAQDIEEGAWSVTAVTVRNDPDGETLVVYYELISDGIRAMRKVLGRDSLSES